MASCDPTSLAQAAKCMSCIPPGMLRSVKTFLYCQYSNVPVGPPATALDINDVTSTNGATVLTWPAIAGASNVQVWASDNGGVFALVTTLGGGAVTFTDPTAIANGAFRTWKVRGVTASTQGTFSNTVSAANNLDISALITVSFPDMIIIYNTFFAFDSATLLSYSFAKLRRIELDTTCLNNANITSISLPVLRTYGGSNAFSANPSLTSIDIHSLQGDLPNFSINDDTALLGAFTLASVTGSLGYFLFFNSAFSSLSFPLVTHVDGDLRFELMPNLTTASFPALLTITGNVSFGQNTKLVSVSFPALNTIGAGGNYDSSQCPLLASLSFPALVTQTIVMDGSQCASLASLTFGPATNFALDLNFATCPALTVVTINAAIFQDNGQVISFNGDNLNQASVDAILHRCVVSGVTTLTIDLSAGTNSTPSAAGLADKATLIGAGNTVVTN